MFSGFMVNTWIAATMVAVIAGVVGFFVVLRGSAFAAHAIPHGAFGGAAGAVLIGVNPIAGLGVFAVGGALGIGWLGRRGRHDVATALSLVLMLGLGALFLSFSVEYAAAIYSLLFGEVLGVPADELLPIAGLGVACIAAIAVLYRPLMLTAITPEVAEARGVRAHRVETGFLLVVALAATMTVPVVGVLLMFSLMIGPAATAGTLTHSPRGAIAVSVVLALATVWLAVAVSYLTNFPIGFFVGTVGAITYGSARIWTGWRRNRTVPA
ncbi:MAG: metal ABC transporter permease [Candidatus Dormibacteria bacterium]|jgi:zinc/manganese transport system permease protein